MCGLSICLGICAVFDVKNKRIPIWILVAAQCISLYNFLNQSFCTYEEGIAGALLGMCFLGISKVTKEAVGYGDSWLIFLLGLGIGVKKTIWLLTIGSILGMCFSLFLLVTKKKSRRETFPFVPFLLMGYMGVMIV